MITGGSRPGGVAAAERRQHGEGDVAALGEGVGGHSMTSSARASTEGGMVRPRAFVVLSRGPTGCLTVGYRFSVSHRTATARASTKKAINPEPGRALAVVRYGNESAPARRARRSRPTRPASNVLGSSRRRSRPRRQRERPDIFGKEHTVDPARNQQFFVRTLVSPMAGLEDGARQDARRRRPRGTAWAPVHGSGRNCGRRGVAGDSASSSGSSPEWYG